MPSTDPPSSLARRLRFAFNALCRTAFAWALAVWTVAGSLWNLLGRYDLALSQLMPTEAAAKFPRAYQAVGMLSAWLSSWEFWTIGGLVLTIGATVEYGVRAEQRGERKAEAAKDQARAYRHPIPPDAPIARAAALSDAVVRFLTESPKPKPPVPPIAPDPEPEWDKLYGVSDDGKDLRLLFLPDGDDLAGR